MHYFSQKRPPRIKRFSPRRLIEWLTETKKRGPGSSSDEANSTTTIITSGDETEERQRRGGGEEAETVGELARRSSSKSKGSSSYNPVAKELKRKSQDLVPRQNPRG